MDRIFVNLQKCNYPIVIKAGLLKQITSFLPLKEGDQVMLITNETLAPLYLQNILNLLKQNSIKPDSVILPDGEQYKSMEVLDSVFTALLLKSHNCKTTLIALGGGVIGDLTGFAAASYQRGIDFIQIPTTLLSQADSSIGGKTAINHPLGKNMIGAIHHPKLVVIDIDCLKTLPAREFASGLAEIIKYGIILDKKFFFWLEENIDALLSLDNHALTYCINHCCKLKATIVEGDEFKIGLRDLLNLGHTFGHAIEVEMGYGNWLHGEAVAAGIVMAARVSERLGQFTATETQRIITLLKRANIPTMGPRKMAVEKYFLHMMRDKKVLSGKIRLVLPLTLGKGEIRSGVPYNIIRDVINGH